METTRYCQTSNFCCIENLLEKHLEAECTRKNQALLMEIMYKFSPLKREFDEESYSYRFHLPSRDNESVLHALWGCEKVQKVWATHFGWVDRNKASSGSFSNLVQLIQEKPHIVSLFSITTWSIWHHRNKSCL